MDLTEIKYFIESALLAAGRPMNIDQIKELFDDSAAPDKSDLRQAIAALNEDYADRGIEVREVASGFRMQVKAGMADRLQKLWEEKPPRYSRALFETLALIAYRQPMTRGEIEEVRGVSVSGNIVRTLLEREWIRAVGHRDVPGRPALFGTTKLFLDYFGLKKLEDLPPLADLADWESLRVQLNLPEVENDAVAVEGADITELALRRAQAGDGEDGDSATHDSGDDEIPVLQPEMVAEDGAESTDGTADDSPILDTDDGFEKLVAKAWPDPMTADDGTDDELIADSDKDIDVSASGA